jgi:hypothetical protein
MRQNMQRQKVNQTNEISQAGTQNKRNNQTKKLNDILEPNKQGKSININKENDVYETRQFRNPKRKQGIKQLPKINKQTIRLAVQSLPYRD